MISRAIAESVRRIRAIAAKEFRQLARDRLTFGMELLRKRSQPSATRQ